MLIAHAPAGYILSKLISKKFFNNNKIYIAIGIFGSIVSDLDIIYWDLVDNRKVNHHEYWTHIPHDWLPLFPLMFVLYFINKKLSIASMFFTLGVYLHLILDSFLAGIKWNYPHSHEYTSLVNPSDIPNLKKYNEPFYTLSFGNFKYDIDGWVYNLAMHWTFQVEIAIILVALVILLFSSFKSRFTY